MDVTNTITKYINPLFSRYRMGGEKKVDEMDLEHSAKDERDVQLEHSAEHERDQYGSSSSGKGILLMLLAVIGIFALLLGGFAIYNNITGGSIINIDDLHKENLEGDIDDEEGYLYNGYSFVKADGLWWTEMNKFGTRLKVPLHFGPKELEDISVTGELDPAFNNGEELFIAIDPNTKSKYYTLAISELSFNTVKGLDRTPVGSCTEESWVCENRTIVSCAKNPEKLPVVELALEGSPGIHIEGTCIRLTGSGEYEIVKSVNRLLYQWYGVMG